MNVCDVRAWKMCEELARECGLEIEVTDLGFTLYSGSDREMALTYVDDDARAVRWYLLGYRERMRREGTE